MIDLSLFDHNDAANPNNNIFGLPFSEEDADLIILPVPWEVTVSYKAGTARAPEHIFKASLQVELYDNDTNNAWRRGIYMRDTDRKMLLKSDYLRKEAELYINYIAQDENVNDNKFMCKTLKEVNEGGLFMNNWVYEQTKELLGKGKLVGLLGGDHSTPLGYYKAIAEKYGDFGILQFDAHLDLRQSYEGFKYSHASIMYNALTEIPQLKKLVQVGIRDYGDNELQIVADSESRIISFFDRDLKNRQYEGENWQTIADEIVEHLPQLVFISFDVDGLDPKLCPNTGTPVMGGLESEQAFYILRKILKTGRRFIGFDLVEVGISSKEWDENVGARLLYKLSNLLLASNPK
ncbi:MAG: agmatinase family protein [Chitinophagaceae bacterium]|nr:agmatinase family protein [Chitinophagaceae bacterium]